jgi:hypothetical protein
MAFPEPPDAPEFEPDGVGIKLLDARFASSGGIDKAESMIGRAFKLSRADSFWSPNRTPEYFPDSFRLGAMSV